MMTDWAISIIAVAIFLVGALIGVLSTTAQNKAACKNGHPIVIENIVYRCVKDDD